MDNLLNITTGISLFISFFLAFFMLTANTKHKTSNRIFAFFLIITAIDTSEPLISHFTNGPSNLGILRTTLCFLQIPTFYLYVLSVCYSDFRWKPKYLIHLLPFLIANLALLPRFYLVDIDSKLNFIINRQNMIELQMSHWLFHLQVLVYFTAIFLLLRRAKKLYLENNSGENLHSYQWLFQLTSVLAVLYLIVIFKNIFKFSDYPYISDWIKIGILMLQPFITCWYLYKALNNPGLFRNIDSKLKLVSDLVLEEKTIELETLNEDLLKLKKYMTDEKPFLNPDLKIQDISKEIDVPVRELSVLINHQLGQHFYDFVNTYRIENAMEILKDSSKSKVTILEILYEVGFNSKSSFNTAFKKQTGNTPTEYRKAV
ncbi:helix-turn-helix domain-containing protein [Chryseobacterium sp. Ch-15]|uniref:AraC family transcriptional regulator n=1 Tax=Chryseobacterium muglaense TaxID=2893752 RepID=A0A9Q3UXX1_9FLAO|nr:helix-turn-helix domain-containing protein [Chryseobacterium muglaense]MBD3906719.1 AraC family transcriptional regulator [Chryseobacterium muglaense]MCC9036617.1 helix-turn-helix domain-containing protein [Chryseobacterium muglaense]MCM2556487.1 helix-turn-helix domain-containing protein [Chryseobacterium muglaense]